MLICAGLAIALLAGIAGAVVGTGENEEGNDTAITFAHTVLDRPETVSPADMPDDILGAVLAAEASPRIVSGGLGPAPADFLRNGYSGTWVFFVVEAPTAEGPQRIRATWDAVIAAGAFRDEMQSAGLPVPQGYAIAVRRPDGTSNPYSAWPFGNVAYGQQFRAADSSAAAESEIQDRVVTAGLKPVEIDVLAPRDLAVAAVTQIADAGAIQSRPDVDRMIETTFSDFYEYEGFYFEIQDRAGTPLFVLARSFRTGIGLSYAALSLGLEPLRGPLRRSD